MIKQTYSISHFKIPEKEDFEEVEYGPCNIGPSDQERLDRSVYLTYVERGHWDVVNYKKISKDEFVEKLFTDLLKDSDRKSLGDNQHRTADFVTTWRTKNSPHKMSNILGQIWTEGDLHSFWINEEYL